MMARGFVKTITSSSLRVQRYLVVRTEQQGQGGFRVTFSTQSAGTVTKVPDA